MAEYVEKELAEEFCQEAYNKWNLAMACADGQREINKVFKMQDLCKAVKGIIKNLPAADVAPVVHGRWYDRGSLSSRCSECGCKNSRETMFCPNCGAKMDKEGQKRKGGKHEQQI